MPSTRNSLRLLALASVLALAPSCASNQDAAPATFPPIADLAPADPEPMLDPMAVASNSEAALDEYDISHRAWGRRWHDASVRVCMWFKTRGVQVLCDVKPH